MKKKLIKSALLSLAIILLIPFAFSNNTAIADEPSAADKNQFAEVLKGEAPCIKDQEGEPDNGYIITIIEEPLDVENKSNEAEFQLRSCYRNTFQFTNPATGERSTIAQLLKECSTKAQEDANNADQSFKATFSCREVQVILSKGGTTMIYYYIGTIYRWGAGLVGIIAVTLIIISGIQISTAGGEPDAINAAKKRILQSIAGIVVLFLSGLILYTVNPNFFTAGP